MLQYLKNQVSIAITAGDIEIHSGQYLLNLGPSVHVTSVAGPVLGITTFTSSFAHGLTAGSKVEFKDTSNNKLGTSLLMRRLVLLHSQLKHLTIYHLLHT